MTWAANPAPDWSRYRCRHCHAAPGEPCRSQRGAVLEWQHREREPEARHVGGRVGDDLATLWAWGVI